MWNAEHDDRAGADVSGTSIEGLEMGGSGVVPTVRAASHQVRSAAAAPNLTSAGMQSDGPSISLLMCSKRSKVQEQSDGPQIHQPHQLFVTTVSQFMRYAHAAALFLMPATAI